MSSASAEGMDETTIVRLAVRHGGDALFGDRDQRDAHPLFPFGGDLRMLIDVEQKPDRRAGWAGTTTAGSARNAAS